YSVVLSTVHNRCLPSAGGFAPTRRSSALAQRRGAGRGGQAEAANARALLGAAHPDGLAEDVPRLDARLRVHLGLEGDQGAGHVPNRKSTRLNSSHVSISYAVFCFKKKTTY